MCVFGLFLYFSVTLKYINVIHKHRDKMINLAKAETIITELPKESMIILEALTSARYGERELLHIMEETIEKLRNKQ